MQIILIPDRLARARTLNVSAFHLFAAGLLGFALLCAATAGL